MAEHTVSLVDTSGSCAGSLGGTSSEPCTASSAVASACSDTGTEPPSAVSCSSSASTAVEMLGRSEVGMRPDKLAVSPYFAGRTFASAAEDFAGTPFPSELEAS